MLTGAIAADPLGVLVAFGAGILSFLSPCVLPLVPGYLSMVSGLSAAELGAGGARKPASGGPDQPATGEGRVLAYSAAPAMAGGMAGAAGGMAGAPAGGGGATPGAGLAGGWVSATSGGGSGAVKRPMKPLLRGIFLFVAGFTLVFVAVGAAASGLGHVLDHHKHGLLTVSGAVVVALGVVMLASSLPPVVWSKLGGRVSARVGWLIGERRAHVRPQTLGTWAAPVMGMAFAFAWTPCIGPVLGAVTALAETRSTLAGGVLLLFAYSLGLGVPFLVTGIAFNRLTGLFARARRPLAVVQVVAGAVLIAFGVLLVAGDLGWLSAQFSSLLNHLGLGRLTTS